MTSIYRYTSGSGALYSCTFFKEMDPRVRRGGRCPWPAPVPAPASCSCTVYRKIRRRIARAAPAYIPECKPPLCCRSLAGGHDSHGHLQQPRTGRRAGGSSSREEDGTDDRGVRPTKRCGGMPLKKGTCHPKEGSCRSPSPPQQQRKQRGCDPIEGVDSQK